MKGMVYMVGAGPGDPGLITVKGLECLRRAQVVVYDRLINASLLKEAPPDAEFVFAGKAPGKKALSQEEINLLLVARGKEGKVVCRLKGGDPFVFGRGGEEAEALAAAGVPFEVVPGVTSAIAVPAYAGIPVTHRGLSSSFAVVTGHEEASKAESTTPWEALAEMESLVFLMGMENLEQITQQLLRHGSSPQKPVALIRWGSFPQQETLVGRLGDIAAKAREAGFESPAVIVMGEVVALRQKLRWFDNKPLFGLRVLVTRTREQAGQLSSLLAEQGAQPLELPLIRIEPPADASALDAALDRLGDFDWIVFTSANGVKVLWERLTGLGKDARALGGAKLCAIGPATARELEQHGLRADFVPEEYIAEAILEGIGPIKGKRILLPCAAEAREVLAEGLRLRGALVEEVATYRTLPTEATGLKEMLKGVDMVTFTSSSTVRSFCQALGEEAASLMGGIKVACIGPVTARTAEELGLNVDIMAQEHTIPGLVRAILEYRRGKAS